MGSTERRHGANDIRAVSEKSCYNVHVSNVDAEKSKHLRCKLTYTNRNIVEAYADRGNLSTVFVLYAFR